VEILGRGRGIAGRTSRLRTVEVVRQVRDELHARVVKLVGELKAA
jgi:hypothetical protein